MQKSKASGLSLVKTLWAWARSATGATGPWLCGEYSAADAFFAPVAGRIAGYNLPVAAEAAAYVAAHLAHSSFRRWRAMGMVDGADQDFYYRNSGKPVTDFMDLDGKLWGFCNPFCRDKTVADPEAWPKFMALYQS